MTDPLLDDAPFVVFLGESVVVSIIITVGVDLVVVFKSTSVVIAATDGVASEDLSFGACVVLSTTDDVTSGVGASVVVSAIDRVASEVGASSCFCY